MADILAPGPLLAHRPARVELGAVTVVDHPRVPDNAPCRRTGTRVEGNVVVKNIARLGADRVTTRVVAIRPPVTRA